MAFRKCSKFRNLTNLDALFYQTYSDCLVYSSLWKKEVTCRQHWYMLEYKIYFFLYYLSLIWSVTSCVSSKYDFCPPPRPLQFGQVKVNLEADWGCGTGYSTIPRMKATFRRFFSPSHSTISHYLRRRNLPAVGGFTLQVVTQNVPVGCESGTEVAVGASESGEWCHRYLLAFCRAWWALPHSQGHDDLSSF